MLIINTEVNQSPIHGTGLFTTEKLSEGQVIWVMHKSFDGAFTKHEWEMLPIPAKNYLQTYMYWSMRLERYVACLDNSRHMNHSDSPNTITVYFNNLNEVPRAMRESTRMTDEQWQIVNLPEGLVITTKEVLPHEELLCNYHIDFPDFGGAGTLNFLENPR